MSAKALWPVQARCVAGTTEGDNWLKHSEWVGGVKGGRLEARS